jgi:hypothetical protein
MNPKSTFRLPSLDRREFMGTAVAAAVLPAAALVPEAKAATTRALPDDWSIDDQWSGYPRYAEPIGIGRMERSDPPRVKPVDAQFVDC